jgi:prefoldin subunit 5
MSNLVEQADAIISKETKDKAVQIIKNKIERLKELRQEKEEIEKQIRFIEEVLERWNNMSAEAVVKESIYYP